MMCYFVPSTIFGDPLQGFFMAGAIFGEPILPCFFFFFSMRSRGPPVAWLRWLRTGGTTPPRRASRGHLLGARERSQKAAPFLAYSFGGFPCRMAPAREIKVQTFYEFPIVQHTALLLVRLEAALVYRPLGSESAAKAMDNRDCSKPVNPKIDVKDCEILGWVVN